MRRILPTLSAGLLLLPLLLPGAETIHVNNLTGSDDGDGSRERPYATLYKACRMVPVSGRIEVANTGKPYQMPYKSADVSQSYGYRLFRGGTLEKPLIVEGNGATISGLAVVPAEAWKAVPETRLFRLPFYPMSNRLKNDKKIQHWLEVPRIWFVDGGAAPNCRDREELLKTPGGFQWNKAEKLVYFHLPEGKRLEELRIELPANYGFYIHASHTIVRNFNCIFSVNDGFDADGSPQNSSYINCLAYDNCGQGFSCHRTSSIRYIGCGAIRCASSNVCNVNSSHAEYVDCVFLDNAFESNVSLYNEATARFVNCFFSGGNSEEPIVQEHASQFTFLHCVIQGSRDLPLLRCRSGSVNFYQCTLSQARYLADFSAGWSRTCASMKRCVVSGMKNGIAKLPATPYPRLQFADNRFSPAFYIYEKRAEKIGGPVLRKLRVDADSRGELIRPGGLRNAESAGSDGYGAGKLSPTVRKVYDRLVNFTATPAGLVPAGKAGAPAGAL